MIPGNRMPQCAVENKQIDKQKPTLKEHKIHILDLGWLSYTRPRNECFGKSKHITMKNHCVTQIPGSKFQTQELEKEKYLALWE